MHMKNIRQRGFTLLLAALVAAIVLMLATAIFSIAQKQATLASLSQQSQYAFYAADTAAECALYWDIRYNYFGTTTPATSDLLAPTPHPNVATPPVCDGSTISVLPLSPGPIVNYTQTFTLPLQGGNFCAKVQVIKCQGTISGGGSCSYLAGAPISTQIRSYGFNTACGSISTNPVALQRSVELNY